MPRTAADVTIRFTGETDDLSRKLEKLERDVSGTATEIEEASKKSSRGLKDVGDRANDAGDRLYALSDAITGTQNVMEGLASGNLLQVGLGLADIARSASDLASGFVEWGRRAWEASADVVKAHAASIAAKAQDLAATVAHRAATIASTVATQAMAAAQWLLNAAMAANPVVLVVAAIAALTAGVILAYQHFEPFRNIVDAVGRALRDVFLGALDAVTAALGAIVDAFGAAIGFIRDHADTLIRVVLGILTLGMSEVARFVLQHIDDIVRFFRELPGRAVTALGNIGQTIWNAVSGGMAELIAAVSKVVSDIVQFFIDLPGRITALGGQFVAAGVSVVDSMWEGLKNIVGKMADFAAAVLGRILSLPGELGHAAFMAGASVAMNLFNGLEQLWAKFSQWVAGIITGLWGAAWEAGKAAWDVGMAIVNGVIDAVKDLPDAIWERIKGGISGLAGRIKGALTFDIPGIDVPGFASGGVVDTTFQVVGEDGPELAMLPKGTRVFSNTESRQMLSSAASNGRALPVGQQPIVVNIYNPVMRSDGQADQLGWRVGRELAVALRGAVG